MVIAQLQGGNRRRAARLPRERWTRAPKRLYAPWRVVAMAVRMAAQVTPADPGPPGRAGGPASCPRQLLDRGDGADGPGASPPGCRAGRRPGVGPMGPQVVYAACTTTTAFLTPITGRNGGQGGPAASVGGGWRRRRHAHPSPRGGATAAHGMMPSMASATPTIAATMTHGTRAATTCHPQSSRRISHRVGRGSGTRSLATSSTMTGKRSGVRVVE